MTVFYRKLSIWFHPQIKFNDDDSHEFVVGDYEIEQLIHGWIELGLTQSSLAAGYDESVENVIVTRQSK